MGIVETLASYADTVVPEGIDWDALKPGCGTPDECIDGFKAGTTRSYYSYLQSAMTKADVRMGNIGLNIRKVDWGLYNQSAAADRAMVEKNREVLEAALSVGMKTLVQPIQFGGEAIFELLQGYAAHLYNGFLLHRTKIIFKMGLTNAQIKAHADRVCRGYNQLSALYDSGVLAPFAQAKATQGLGLGPAGIAIIAFAAILAIAVICGAIVFSIYLSQINSMALAICNRLMDEKDPDKIAFCQYAITPKVEDPTATITKNLMFYGTIGIGVLAFVYFMPFITSQFIESRRRLRS